MTVKGTFAIAGLALLVTACAEEPQNPFGPGQEFTYNANQWTVSDRQDLSQLQIVATSSMSAGIGTAGGYRYASDTLPQPVVAEAVRGWFLTTGRHCTVDDGTPTAAKTYVFHYSCW